MNNVSKIELAIGSILIFLIGFMLGFILDYRTMLRDSVQGYRAFPTYQTNEVGEVKIEKIEWSKTNN